ncbi:MAG: hypothetical protein ABIU54_13035 [Candidatus Eisenbacteria bacterium]
MRSILQPAMCLGLLFLELGGTTPAGAACRQCGSNFACLSASEGAQVCLAFGNACTMAGPCYAGHSGEDGGLDDPILEAVTAITVLDEVSTALGGTGVRIERALGEDLAAAAAARGWASRIGGAPRPTLVAGLMHGQGIPIAVRTREGDGFVLDRRDSRRGIKLVVRSMFAGQPGHVIVSRYVEDGDLVALRATVGGRHRTVLVQVLRLSTTRDAGRLDRMQALVTAAARERQGAAALDVDLVPVPE